MKDFSIDGRKINENSYPLIIPEIGINHNGSLKVAKKMIDAAARAGAEIIKHQTHVIEDEMSRHASKTIPGNSNKSIMEIMSSCCLSEEEEFELMKYTERKGLIFLSTPFSREAFRRLERFGVKAYKVGSGECNNYPLLKLISKTKKPTIMSTGMNNISSIQKAVTIFKKNNCPLALMHTTNLYPTPDRLIRLGAMIEMRDAFPDLIYGLSDHSIDNLAAKTAISIGAMIIERHFTDTRKRKGPDIICSMNGSELKKLIEDSKRIIEFRGGKKEAAKEEEVTKKFAFASIVSDKDIKKGEKFNLDNIWVRRPGTGDFLAEDYQNILGRKALRDISMGEQIKKQDVFK